MVNMLDAIAALELEFARKKAVMENELSAINQAIDTLKKLNEACPECHGKGWYLRKRACAEDDRPDPDDPSDRIRCSHCGGTGYRDNILRKK